MIANLEAGLLNGTNNVGRFARFVWQSITTSIWSCAKKDTYPLIWTQMNVIGVRSVPVVMITGAFVGHIKIKFSMGSSGTIYCFKKIMKIVNDILFLN